LFIYWYTFWIHNKRQHNFPSQWHFKKSIAHSILHEILNVIYQNLSWPFLNTAKFISVQ
jgi:hypothetical protein